MPEQTLAEKTKEMIDVGNSISKQINCGDFIAAEMATQLLPKETNKDIIYALMAIKATEYATRIPTEPQTGENMPTEKARELMLKLADSYKKKCDYFKEE